VETDGEERSSRRIRLALTSEAEVDALRGGGTPGRISEVRAPSGRCLAAIDELTGGGFVLWAEDFGRAWLSTDGGEARCAPAPQLPDWRRERFLTAHVLPFAALLQGLEVFHASGVVADGQAVALVGGSGVGKTSLALNLALRGLGFLNDDVLVVEPAESGGVVAHPGAGVANVRRDGTRLAERVRDARLGAALGEDEQETRMLMSREHASSPLGAVFYVHRDPGARQLAVTRSSPADPRTLLASTFNFAVRTPERLARQLEVCGRIAETCAVFMVECPGSVDATALATAVYDTVRGLGAEPS
jgi:hypothetical protein